MNKHNRHRVPIQRFLRMKGEGRWVMNALEDRVAELELESGLLRAQHDRRRDERDAFEEKVEELERELRKLRAERDTLMNVVEMLSRYDPLEHPNFYSVINKAKAAIAKAKGGE